MPSRSHSKDPAGQYFDLTQLILARLTVEALLGDLVKQGEDEIKLIATAGAVPVFLPQVTFCRKWQGRKSDCIGLIRLSGTQGHPVKSSLP